MLRCQARRFRSDRRWHRVTRLGRSAVNDVVLFGQRKALALEISC